MKFWGKLRRLIFRRKLDAEMGEEMRVHLDMLAERNRAAGMNEEEARFAARREFGGEEQIKERCREQRSWGWLEQIGEDVRHAVRMLRRQPFHSTIVVVTLAAGIGLGTAGIGTVHSVFNRTKAINDVERLTWIYGRSDESRITRRRIAAEDLAVLGRSSATLTALAGIGDWTLTWDGGGRRARWTGLLVEGPLADVLAVKTEVGRPPFAQDFAPSSPNRIWLSRERWINDFGADPGVVGQQLVFDDDTYEVTGVLPEGLAFPVGVPPQAGNGGSFRLGAQDFWVARNGPADARVSERAFTGIGRLRTGATRAEAEQDARAAARQLSEGHPESHRGWTYEFVAVREQMLGPWARAWPMLIGAVALLFAIASGNAGNLVLARAAARQNEFAVRAALGGGRGRLGRQVVVEQTVLAMVSGLLGAGVAMITMAMLSGVEGAALPFLDQLKWSARSPAWCILLTLASGLWLSFVALTGLAATKGFHGFRSQGSQTGDRRMTRLRKTVVVAQIALALGLMTGATMLLKSFSRLMQVDLGYAVDHVLTAEIEPARGAEPSVWFGELFERVRRLPGVRAVGTVHSVPLTGQWVFRETILVPGGEETDATAPLASGSLVSEDYFNAAGVALLGGRSFTAAEVASAGDAPVIVLNETAARRYFPAGDAIGRRVQVPGRREREVIGIVRDTLDRSLDAPVEPQFYLPAVMGGAQLIVRTEQSAAALAETLWQTLLDGHSRAVVNRVRPLEQIVAATVADRRLAAAVGAGFAAAAFGMVMAGLYGLMTLTVQQRTREIGIRMAVGARPAAIGRMLLSQGARLIGAGLLLGGGLAVLTAAAVAPLLFRAEDFDVASHAAVSAGVLLTGLLACWIPARRATKVDPIMALRAE
jgi:predicted permease